MVDARNDQAVTAVAANELLSCEVREKIDYWLAKYPAEQRKSAVIPALHIVQDANQGWLSNELMEAVAEYLDIPKISVYEVATFYSMFELKPVGRHRIAVCTNLSCMLCGVADIGSYLKEKLGINYGESTEDGKFFLKEVECLAACGGAPVMQVNKDYHENLTREKVDKILAELE